MYSKYLYFFILMCLFFSGLDFQKASISPRFPKAQEMKRYMNLSVDPCDDFYEYACGNYRTAFPSKSVYPITVLQQLEDKIDKDLLKLLIQPLRKSDNSMSQHMKDFYNSCTDTYQISKVGNEPIKSVIKRLGGMPLLENYWDESAFNWINTISDFKEKFNVDILINLTLRESERKYTKAFYLDSPNYQPIYKLFKSRQDALREVTALLEKFSNKNDQIRKVAEEILNTEYNLFKNNPQVIPGKSNEYVELDMNLYQRPFDNIDYNKYISASVPHVSNSYKRYISTDGYFENLQLTITSTSPKNIANFIMWNFIRHMNMTIYQEKNIIRRKFCLNLAKQYFPQVLGDMYNKPNEYILTSIEADLDFLKLRLKSTLGNKEFEGMANEREFKSIIQTKLTHMNMNYIKYTQPEVIESLPPFNRTAIQPNNFLHNLFTLMSMQASNAKNKIYGEMNKKITTSQVESYSVFPTYQYDQNTIRIPKGLFNHPLYNSDFPNSIKFGQIGVLISREIIKALTANISDRSFSWVERALEKLGNRTKCFVEQYKNYKFGDGYLPENEQQIENIADNGAVRIAFKAYLNWLSDESIPIETLKNETLKGFDYTNTQLFFISYAQTYCSTLNETGELILPDNKDFIPEKIRVNAALTNFDEFSTEFNCPIGSIMSAPEKCIYY
ncbi:hypothetical protein ACFFRR_005727 [Megaselia abdita]